MRIFSTKTNYRILKSVHPFIKLLSLVKLDNPNYLLRKRFSLYWLLNLDEVIDLCIYLFGAFDKQNLEKAMQVVSPGAVVFDIGANIGAFALPIANRVGKTGRVYAIEPSHRAIKKLNQNITINEHLANVITPLQCFVSNGEVMPQKVYSLWNMSQKANRHKHHLGILELTQDAVELKLDDIIKEAQIDKIDLLKIDVDGYETTVLKSGIESIKKFNPIIFIEFCEYALQENNSSVKELSSILYDLEYSLYTLADELLKNPNEILSKIPNNGIINIVAKPKAM